MAVSKQPLASVMVKEYAPADKSQFADQCCRWTTHGKYPSTSTIKDFNVSIHQASATDIVYKGSVFCNGGRLGQQHLEGIGKTTIPISSLCCVGTPVN
ncbi:MAG: hypothetical protein IPH36_01525 [Saprospiraceae bacterium]|nr:hypothetical protein [Saprospiraceae bacterium]